MEKEASYENFDRRWKEMEPILVQWKLGDEKAFSRIFSTYHGPLCAYAYSITDNKTVSREIVSDAFLAIWNRKNLFQTIKDLEAFVRVCVKNSCIDYTRSEKRKIVREKITSYLYADEGEGSDEKITPENVEAFYNELNHLPRQQKQVIEMYIKGLKTREIADELSISAKTVQNYKERALNSLQERLSSKIRKPGMFLLSLFPVIFISWV